MPRKNQPENAERCQRKHRRLKFPPNLGSLARPDIDGVIENQERADRAENADCLRHATRTTELAKSKYFRCR